RNAARVGVNVGDHELAPGPQDLVGRRGDGAVGRLHDELGLDTGGVFRRDLVLQGGRDQDVALVLQQAATVLDKGGAGETGHAPVLPHPVGDRFHVEALFVVEGAVPLDDADNLGAVFFLQDLGRVIPHIA